MAATEATLKTAIFPGMVEVETSVIPSLVMTDPFAVAVHVRGLRMAVAIPKRLSIPVVMMVIVAIVFMPVAVISLRAMVRNVSSTDVVAAVVAIVVLVFLGECRQRQEQCDCKHFGKQFH
jgi:choline-glycine betaine transporter